MQSTPLIPAAQYVRMSTEDQQYSIANQEAAIAEYARKRGFEVMSRLSWKWRKRSSVKIAERTYEKRAQALHC